MPAHRNLPDVTTARCFQLFGRRASREYSLSEARPPPRFSKRGLPWERRPPGWLPMRVGWKMASTRVSGCARRVGFLWRWSWHSGRLCDRRATEPDVPRPPEPGLTAVRLTRRRRRGSGAGSRRRLPTLAAIRFPAAPAAHSARSNFSFGAPAPVLHGATRGRPG